MKHISSNHYKKAVFALLNMFLLATSSFSQVNDLLGEGRPANNTTKY